jgi:hypothetical protein
MLTYVVGVYAVCVWLHLKNVVASFFMVCDFLCNAHLFFNDNEHIINNIRADPEYRGANAAIRRQLEAELQAIHDMNRTEILRIL